MIKQIEEGKYALSGDGREALKVLNAIEEARQSSQNRVISMRFKRGLTLPR
ncbi:MAG: hypothetical protein ACUVQY_02615 [Thermoproteota archaeon]